MDNTWIFIVVAVLVLLLAILSFRGGKTKKYRVVTSQPDPQTGGVITEELSRGWSDRLDDAKDMKCFKNAEGKRVQLGTHWIIRIEEM